MMHPKYFLMLFFLLCFHGLMAQQFPLSFSQSVWEVGDIPQKGLKNQVIQVTNVTESPVGIYQFNPMNPMVSGRARKTLLQAGETTDVHLQMYAHGEKGDFAHKIVVTLIGDKRTAEIIVKGKITEPQPLGVGKIKPDTAGLPVLKVGK